MTCDDLPPELLRDMRDKRIDVDLTLDILNRANRGEFRGYPKVIPSGVPQVDGVSVIDLRNATPRSHMFRISKRAALENLERFNLSARLLELTKRGAVAETIRGGEIELLLSAAALTALGNRLLATCAFGVLNGGSATSYCDQKKNQAIDASLFTALRPLFSTFAPEYRDMPKGLTPAYINSDGSPGASFLELKMRARLVAASRLSEDRRGDRRGGIREPFMPLFQMTSQGNHETLLRAYADLAKSPLLAPLAERHALCASAWLSGIQPMIAAFSPSSAGEPLRIFDSAFGAKNSALPLPGGHGQSFLALRAVFESLRAEGMRFAMLSNVDNLGATPDPVELAILALSGRPAGFDFSYKTPIDVKGGILVSTPGGGKTIVDIGPAIDIGEIERLEERGEAILFNCATGIFDLDWLCSNIEHISRALPIRFSDQNKDAGLYSQAEQVTWEVVSLLPDFIAFAVQKQRRFVAAKMLVEMLLASGFGAEREEVPQPLRATGRMLHEGQSWLLSNIYGMRLDGGRWVASDEDER